jgi:hypothetical protein
VSPLPAAVRGGLAGLCGAASAHLLAALAGRAGSDGWLRGPYGPAFFCAALYTGLFYAAIGAAAGRRAGAAAGFLGGFLGLLVPLYVLTRYGGWTERQWTYAAVVPYIAAVWGTIAAIGAVSAPGRPWRGALAAAGGSLAAYAALSAAARLAPGLAAPARSPAALLAPPLTLLDGLLSGAGLCLALSLNEGLSRRPS